MPILPTSAPGPASEQGAPAPRRRAIFLDFDGTTAHHGIIPPTNVEAIQAVRAAGHAVLVCTGRPACIVPDDVLELVDGVVCSAGAHVRIGGEQLSDIHYPADLAERALGVLAEADATIVLEGTAAIYCTPSTAREFAAAVGGSGGAEREPGSRGSAGAEILDAVRTPEDLRGVPFAKILVRRAALGLTEIAERIGPEIRALPSSIQDDRSSSGELQLADVDKADGMRLAIDHLGIGIADTIGVGDGANDVGMLAAAGTAVAIEGSRPEVLAEADLVVPGPREGGLAVAFSRLGLI